MIITQVDATSHDRSSRQAHASRQRRRLVCLGAGIASLLLLVVVMVLELLESKWFPFLAVAIAFVLQAACGSILWRVSTAIETSPPKSTSDNAVACIPQGREPDLQSVDRSGDPTALGSYASPSTRQLHIADSSGEQVGSSTAVLEEGAGRGNCVSGSSRVSSTKSGRKLMDRRDARSSRRIAVGDGSSKRAVGGDGRGATMEEEESFNRHFALETPLQQAARTLEFVLDKYSPDVRTQEKLEMVLNIISLPEDLNTVTMQSIRNADLDSSTAEWIEAQLSSGASSHNNHTGEVKWLRLKEGLKGVVHRMASEFAGDQRDISGTDTGMNSKQLSRQHEVGRAYKMEKTASNRSRGQSTSINVSQLMTLPGARVSSATLVEVDECSQMDEMSDVEENAEHAALLELMPTWPGIQTENQTALVALILAKHFLDWGFSVFKLNELSEGHALWYTGMLTLYHYNFVGVFNVAPTNLSRFLMHVEHNYCFDPANPNPYHTSLHAADVTLTVAHFCENSIIASGLKALQGFALLVAAIVHDYRHRGVNNGYLMKVRDDLAMTYNDASVLENFHVSEAFKVIYAERTNIVGGLTVDEMRHFRQFIIKIVLATDLAHGFEYVARFTASTNTKGGRRASIVPDMAREEVVGAGTGGGTMTTAAVSKAAPAKDPLQAQILLMQMVVKVADVAHPMKPWELHERWTKLITEEFHRQGDLEAERGVPISPLCSRDGHNQAKSQCDFVNFVVRPCATVFSEFCKDRVWVTTLESNYRRWLSMT